LIYNTVESNPGLIKILLERTGRHLVLEEETTRYQGSQLPRIFGGFLSDLLDIS